MVVERVQIFILLQKLKNVENKEVLSTRIKLPPAFCITLNKRLCYVLDPGTCILS